MTQFNLLPDVKLEYLKAERLKHLVMTIAVFITLAAIVLVAILFSLIELQKSQINSLSSDIRSQGLKMSGNSGMVAALPVTITLSSLLPWYLVLKNLIDLSISVINMSTVPLIAWKICPSSFCWFNPNFEIN